MSMRINTNLDALNAQRNLAATGALYAKSVEKLSSGLRINRAGDDAAGLSISEKLRGQIKGLAQAQRNAQDGISMIQTAEGALNETHSILQRMRELSVQASNGTLTAADQGAIGTEMTSLGAEIDRIGNSTQFNGKTLLDGGLNTTLTGGTAVQGALLATSNVAISALNVTNATGGHTYTITGTATTLTLTDGTTNVAQTLTTATMMSTGTSTQTLNFSQLGVSIALNGFDAANGTAAKIGADLNTKTLITGAGGSVNFQIGANTLQTVAVGIADARSTAIGSGGGYGTLSAAVAAFGGGPSAAIAQNLMVSIDQAIADISSNRSTLGASQNRLEHTISNLGVSQENLTASESRIRDVDMAAEMVNFTKTGILQQAGQAILAQANQSGNGVMSLLR